MSSVNVVITCNILVTDEDIDGILCTAIEGGINRWAGIDNTLLDWEDKLSNTPISEHVTKLILSGKSVKLFDVEECEDDSEWILTKENLLIGLQKFIPTRGKELLIDIAVEEWGLDVCNIDADDADSIIQYSLFGKEVFD